MYSHDRRVTNEVLSPGTKGGGGGDIYTILSLLEDYSWHIVYRSQIDERTI
jgi:hypothetical protein